MKRRLTYKIVDVVSVQQHNSPSFSPLEPALMKAIICSLLTTFSSLTNQASTYFTSCRSPHLLMLSCFSAEKGVKSSDIKAPFCQESSEFALRSCAYHAQSQIELDSFTFLGHRPAHARQPACDEASSRLSSLDLFARASTSSSMDSVSAPKRR